MDDMDDPVDDKAEETPEAPNPADDMPSSIGVAVRIRLILRGLAGPVGMTNSQTYHGHRVTFQQMGDDLPGFVTGLTVSDADIQRSPTYFHALADSVFAYHHGRLIRKDKDDRDQRSDGQDRPRFRLV